MLGLKLMRNKNSSAAKIFSYFICFAPVIFFIVIFYFWIASAGTFSFDKSPGHYGELAEGFAQGHLNLSIDPDPRLLQLPDPYDPSQNIRIRYAGVHDVSLFRDKFYLYFGPGAALMAYLPYHFFTGQYPDQRWAAVMFASASFCILSLLFILMARPETKSQIVYVNLLMLLAGFGNLVPYFLARSDMYEVAISSGTFTTSLFLLSLFLASKYKKNSPVDDGFRAPKPEKIYNSSSRKKSRQAKMNANQDDLDVSLSENGETRTLFFLSFASLMAGMGVACRPNLIVLVFPLFICSWVLCDEKKRLKWAGIILAPLAFCGLMLAMYNYERFGSFTDFGSNYQLAGFDQRHEHWFNYDTVYGWKRQITALYMYFLNPPDYSIHFPFIIPSPHCPAWMFPGGTFVMEPIVGVLFGMPIVVLSFFSFLRKNSPRLILKSGFLKSLRNSPERLTLFVASVSFTAIFGLLLMIALIGTTSRYFVDFSGVLIFVSIALWYRNRPKNVIFGLVLLYTLIFGFMTGVQGYYNRFGTTNPDLIRRIERMFTF